MTVVRLQLYSLYERVWHWLQALVILLLLLTGLEIHAPSQIGVFGFSTAVSIHTAMGFALLINAFFALFYQLATQRIRAYLPEPRDFVSQAVGQALYYVRGIFRGDPHPLQRTADRRLNPLQQVTYLAILNVLLPLQVLTGLLMWGLQRWPDLGGWFGGLAVLAPVHTLAAWLFAAFLLMHVYLTTTGTTPLSNMRAMVTGYEDVEPEEDDVLKETSA
jgi:Ni/Fe-hydrogenase b-type cytochrome subunit